MCFFSKPAASQVVQQTMPAPEQTAEPASIGKARKAADKASYGSSAPDLTVQRSANATPPSAASGGAGLNLM